MNWALSDRADPLALPIADRHYNRQTPGILVAAIVGLGSRKSERPREGSSRCKCFLMKCHILRPHMAIGDKEY